MNARALALCATYNLTLLIALSSRDRLCRRLLFRCLARARVSFLHPYRAGCFIVIQLSPLSRHYPCFSHSVPRFIFPPRTGEQIVQREMYFRAYVYSHIRYRMRTPSILPADPSWNIKQHLAVLCHSRTLCRSTWISALLLLQYLTSRSPSLPLSLSLALALLNLGLFPREPE